MEGCSVNFSCLQNYLKHNIEKLALNTQDKSRHEAKWRDFKNLFIYFNNYTNVYLFMYLFFSSTLFLLAYVNCIFVKKLIILKKEPCTPSA